MAHRYQVLYFKSCPRCQGDLYLDSDYYGTYKQCLQCGYIVDVEGESQEAAVAQQRIDVKAA